MDASKIPEEIKKELQDKDEKVAATQQAKGGPGAGQNIPKCLQCLWQACLALGLHRGHAHTFNMQMFVAHLRE